MTHQLGHYASITLTTATSLVCGEQLFRLFGKSQSYNDWRLHAMIASMGAVAGAYYYRK